MEPRIAKKIIDFLSNRDPAKGDQNVIKAEVNKRRRQRSRKTLSASDDGIRHIRVDRDGKTELGRWLSIEYRRAFYHPKYGAFNSIYTAIQWFKLKDEYRNDAIRTMRGGQIRDYLNEISKDGEEIFRCQFASNEVVTSLVLASVQTSPELVEKVLKNEMNFISYTVNDDGSLSMRDTQYIRILNSIRKELINLYKMK